MHYIFNEYTMKYYLNTENNQFYLEEYAYKMMLKHKFNNILNNSVWHANCYLKGSNENYKTKL